MVGEALARRGATVLLSARDPVKAAAAAARPAGEGAGALRSLPAGLDVADAGSVDAAARAVADLTGRLDVLVSNAAAYADWGETATGADLAASRAVMDVNLYGTWGMIQAFLPLLRRSEHPRIGHTGRLVTSGALILCLAFIALGGVPVTDVKILSTGLAAGIIIDATVIRGVLAPALVTLLGRANWWLPRPAARLLRITPLTPGAAHDSPAPPSGVRPASRR